MHLTLVHTDAWKFRRSWFAWKASMGKHLFLCFCMSAAVKGTVESELNGTLNDLLEGRTGFSGFFPVALEIPLPEGAFSQGGLIKPL